MNDIKKIDGTKILAILIVLFTVLIMRGGETMALPIDRTALIAAQTNQVPNALIRSALNIAALTTPYNTIDELNAKVNTNYASGAIGTTQLADGSVTTAKHADGSVTTAKLADSAVTLAKMADSSVGTAELVDLSVTNGKVANATLTADKFVASALTNDTQNGLRITAHEVDINAHSETGNAVLLVGPAGNDTTGTGSTVAPYRTLTKALSTRQKNLHGETKIRVLPGDYRAEGAVAIEYFAGGTLTITAFDGTNDVIIPNDTYIFQNITVYDCDAYVNLWGIKVINPATDSYGIFVQHSRYVYIQGYKNTDSAAVNSGVGITRNSEVHIYNSLNANKSTAISCNFGSRCISQAWDAGSINNTQGLVSHGGSIVHKWGVQPTATFMDVVMEGSTILDEYGNTSLSKSADQTFVSRDLALGGFDITIDLSSQPRWIQLNAAQIGTKLTSQGQWANAKSFSIYVNAGSLATGGFNAIELNDGAGNGVKYQVSTVTKTSITLTKTIDGVGLTGTMYLSVMCGM